LKMTLWDTFGLTEDNWPEYKFRSFLHGKVKNYSIYDQVEEITNQLHFGSISNQVNVNIDDRIHTVLLFMSSDIFHNTVLMNRMVGTLNIAINEGYNPLLMITGASEFSIEDKEKLVQMIKAHFDIEQRQIIFPPYYGNSTKRQFKIDMESLYILDRIKQSAESFLEGVHYESKYSLLDKLCLVTLASLFVAIMRFCIVNLKRNKINHVDRNQSHIDNLKIEEHESESENENEVENIHEKEEDTIDNEDKIKRDLHNIIEEYMQNERKEKQRNDENKSTICRNESSIESESESESELKPLLSSEDSSYDPISEEEKCWNESRSKSLGVYCGAINFWIKFCRKKSCYDKTYSNVASN